MSPARPEIIRRAVERARWLAEVATALDRASAIARTIVDGGEHGADAHVLEARIRLLSEYVDQVRCGSFASDEQHPEWMQ